MGSRAVDEWDRGKNQQTDDRTQNIRNYLV